MAEIRNSDFQVVTLGAVKEDGTPDLSQILFQFPVPHQQMSVKQGIKVDEVDVPGRSGNVKQPVGYEDTDVSINLVLVDEEDRGGNVTRSALTQFGEFQSAFRDRSDPITDDAKLKASFAVPRIYSIQSRLTDACGIRTVLFKSLDVNDTEGNTDLSVSLVFTEFEPVARQVESRAREEAISAATKKELAPKKSAAEQAHDDEVGEEDPLAKAFREGKADAMGGFAG